MLVHKGIIQEAYFR